MRQGSAIRSRPKQRTSDVVVQDYNDEILIYDLRENKAHCLNKTSAEIWRDCDGSKSIDQLAEIYGGHEVVWLAINEMQSRNLVEDVDVSATFSGMSRREVVKKIGLGSMVALPVIASLVAPSSVHAQASCVTSGGTCSIKAGSTPCCGGLQCLGTNPAGNNGKCT
jgi:hypothetical protein